MALINCAECGKEISDKAAACPGCAAPVEKPPTHKNTSIYQSDGFNPLATDEPAAARTPEQTIDRGVAQGRKREKTGEGIASILTLCAIGTGFWVGSAFGITAGVTVMVLMFVVIFAMYWKF